jgi:bacterioferritin-associated ferredoxin
LLICSCKWLTYNEIQSVVDAGAQTVADIQRQCGAGTECGGCLDVLRRMVSEQATPCDADDLSTSPDVDSSAA